jgi:hypothetical protein
MVKKAFHVTVPLRTVKILVEDIERLDQGHLYPNLEVPGLTCPGRESNPGLLRGKRAF